MPWLNEYIDAMREGEPETLTHNFRRPTALEQRRYYLVARTCYGNSIEETRRSKDGETVRFQYRVR